MGVAYHNIRRGNHHRSSLMSSSSSGGGGAHYSHSSHPVLFPCLGVKGPGDQLSLRRSRWVSSKGLGPDALLRAALRAKQVLSLWQDAYNPQVYPFVYPPHLTPYTSPPYHTFTPL